MFQLTIDPHQLVPKLPNPQDLQPFPTQESMVYRGHTDMVRCIDVDPTGQYLFSGSEDGCVKGFILYIKCLILSNFY